MAGKSPTQRQLRAIAGKNHIFEVAISLIKRNGFEQTGVSDICREAGVSTGAFYHYFKSKQDILFELYIRADRFFERNVDAWVRSRDPAVQVMEYMALYIHFVRLEGVDITRNLYNPGNTLFLKQDRSMLTLLEGIISRGQEKGAISKRLGPPEWVRFIFSVLRGLALDWALYKGAYDIEERAKSHIECVGDYLKKQ
ncbi:TetR/AcrR family transcriptional regulator [Breznakiella homolactica]|uniref:TetR/AcrR family transcriptional regulator n=1 Tax=Breznakiella homolactica TaxID=2798577 RepID=A0A7T8B8H1_9SPIR|nr:TetR/AcrR family transcriptional regulator [Breznakiella homolactica]QQO07382.1 TetR/AcrR family transcriptional regulator [Breznakiella homolactica]